jgi:hypothetical protein
MIEGSAEGRVRRMSRPSRGTASGEEACVSSLALTVVVRLPVLRRARREGVVDAGRLSHCLLALAELTVLYLAVADMVVKPSGSGTSVVRYGAVGLALGFPAAAVIAYRARNMDPHDGKSSRFRGRPGAASPAGPACGNVARWRAGDGRDALVTRVDWRQWQDWSFALVPPNRRGGHPRPLH